MPKRSPGPTGRSCWAPRGSGRAAKPKSSAARRPCCGKSAPGPAAVVLTLDTDGTARRVASEYHHLGSFARVSAEVMTGRRISPSTFESSGTVPIDYAGGIETFHSISFAKVLKGEAPPGNVQEQAGDRRSLGADPPGSPLDALRRRHARTGNLGQRRRHAARRRAAAQRLGPGEHPPDHLCSASRCRWAASACAAGARWSTRRRWPSSSRSRPRSRSTTAES